MKTICFTLLLVGTIFFGYCQGEIGYTRKLVNLRDSASSSSAVIEKLLPRTKIFYFVDDTLNGYIKIRLLKNAHVGYIKTSFIKFVRAVKESKNSPFSEIQSDNPESPPELRIFNNSLKTMLLSLNGVDYVFSPYQKINIPFKEGECRFYAMAQKVEPLYGKKKFLSGYYYQWEFYIKTFYR